MSIQEYNTRLRVLLSFVSLSIHYLCISAKQELVYFSSLVLSPHSLTFYLTLVFNAPFSPASVSPFFIHIYAPFNQIPFPFPWLLSLLFLSCFFISHPSFQLLSSFLFISSPTLSLYYPLLSLTPFFPFLVHKSETFVGSYFKICTLFAFNMLKK